MFSWYISNNLPKYLGGRRGQSTFGVELNHYKILEPLKGAPDLDHLLHKKRFLVIAATWKRISKITKLSKIFRAKGQSDSQENGGNRTLIHLMRYKPQIFTDEVLQCIFDKYVITYQNI